MSARTALTLDCARKGLQIWSRICAPSNQNTGGRGNEPSITGDGRTVTARVPISIRKRGGRKLVLAPDRTNVTAAPVRRHIDNAMVKAIARAFRWREMLKNGTYTTIAEIAVVEKINESYVGRVLRLTLLAPDIIEVGLQGIEWVILRDHSGRTSVRAAAACR